jgi:hypothetical protein
MALLACCPLLAQEPVEEEDLPEPDVWEEIIPTYVEAEKVFNSRSQPDSLALFDDFLRLVETASARRGAARRDPSAGPNSHFTRPGRLQPGPTEEVQPPAGVAPARAWLRWTAPGVVGR